MGCPIFYHNGLGECKALTDDLNGFAAVNKGTSITEANAKLLTGWQTLFAPLLASTEILGTFIESKDYNDITDEPEMTKTVLGYMDKTNETPPVIEFWGNMSQSDYHQWYQADGKVFAVPFVTTAGNVVVPRKNDGTIKAGFTAKLFITKAVNKKSADKQSQYKFTIALMNQAEWTNAVELITDFEVPELTEIIPVGLDLKIITPYATGGDVVVKATKRNQPDVPYVGLTETTNYSVKSAESDTTVTLTITSAASASLGIYTLNLVGAASADLTGSVWLQGLDDDGSNTTYLTNILKIN